MLKVLVVGGGAREHAIAWKLLQSPKVQEVLVAPGNAGTALIARNLNIPAKDISGIVGAALSEGVGLVIVGPEDPLAAGLVDALETAHIPAFGPSRVATEIEASKAFAKSLMVKYGIPCAAGATFTSLPEAEAYLRQQELPIVVKADGLATGKGVIVAQTVDEAASALQMIMGERAFGAAGDRVVIEECLRGKEVSLLAFTDGQKVVPMVPACDYKRVYDGDQGPNTGGMGAYSPPGFFGAEMIDEVTHTVLEPTVRAMAAEGRPYRGVLYAGLMIGEQGPKVLEFNARFGDPETQVILPRLRTDLTDIAFAVIEGRLDAITVEWSPEACVGVVVASEGYPGSYPRGLTIAGLDQLDPGVIAFHAGTRLVQRPPAPRPRSLLRSVPPDASFEAVVGEVVTDGGRVLTVVATGADLREARDKVYANLPRITFRGAHFRSDIALRELPNGGKEQAGARGTADPPDQPRSSIAAEPKQAPQQVPAEAAERFALAEQLFASGKMRESAEQLHRVLRLHPGHAAAHALLGTIYLNEAKPADAAKAWEEVVRLSPSDAAAQHNLASVYVRLGRMDAAVERFEASLAVDPAYVPSRLGLGAIFAREGQFQQAVDQYQAALAVDPHCAEAHLDLASVLAKAGERQKAIAALDACLAADPSDTTRAEAQRQRKSLTKNRWLRI